MPKTVEYKCGYCGKTFKYRPEYVQHVDADHWEFNDKTDPGPM